MARREDADPKRWLDDGGGATERERALLRGARDLAPAPGDREAVWAALMTKIGPPPGGASGSNASGGATATASASGSLLAKLGVVALIVVGAMGVYWFVRGNRSDAPTVVAYTVVAPRERSSVPS